MENIDRHDKYRYNIEVKTRTADSIFKKPLLINI